MRLFIQRFSSYQSRAGMRKKMAVTLLSFIVVFSGCTIFTLVLCLILHLDYLHKKYSTSLVQDEKVSFGGTPRQSSARKMRENLASKSFETIAIYMDQ